MTYRRKRWKRWCAQSFERYQRFGLNVEGLRRGLGLWDRTVEGIKGVFRSNRAGGESSAETSLPEQRLTAAELNQRSEEERRAREDERRRAFEEKERREGRSDLRRDFSREGMLRTDGTGALKTQPQRPEAVPATEPEAVPQVAAQLENGSEQGPREGKIIPMYGNLFISSIVYRYLMSLVDLGVIDESLVEEILKERFNRAKFKEAVKKAISYYEDKARRSQGKAKQECKIRLRALRTFLAEAALIGELYEAKNLRPKEVMLFKAKVEAYLKNPTVKDPITKIVDFSKQHLVQGFVQLKLAEGLAAALRAWTMGDISRLGMFAASLIDMHAWLHFTGFVLNQQGAQLAYHFVLGKRMFMLSSRPTLNHALGKGFSLGAAMAIMDMLTMWSMGQGHLIRRWSFAKKVGGNWGVFLGSELGLQFAWKIFHGRLMLRMGSARAASWVLSSG